ARSKASARRSLRASSLIDVPHARTQGFERAELELLHSALGAAERLGDLADALLLDEPGDHDTLLIVRQAADQIAEHGAAVGIRSSFDLARVRRRLSPLSRRPLPAVGDRVPGNLEEPGRERDTSPFEATEIGKCLVEDFRGQILGLTAA